MCSHSQHKVKHNLRFSLSLILLWYSLTGSLGGVGVRRVFGNPKIATQLSADDVALFASSAHELQHVLKQYTAKFEVAEMLPQSLRPWFSARRWWIAPSGLGESCFPKQIWFENLRVLLRKWSFSRTGSLVHHQLQCIVCVLPNRCSEEGAESEDNTLDSPVNLHSNLHPGSWALGSERKNEILESCYQCIVAGVSLIARLRSFAIRREFGITVCCHCDLILDKQKIMGGWMDN